MRRISGSAGLWICAIACSAVVAFGGSQDPSETDPGERIVNRSCLSCHDPRPIETKALDKDGWTKIVNAMLEKGASVPAADVPVVINYLVKLHGPLPEGAGKRILLENCTMCHNLERIKERGSTRDEWDALLGHMLNEGAELSDEDYPVLLGYLTRNFRPQQ